MYMVTYSSYNIYATCYTNMLSEFGKKVEDLKGKLSVEGLLKYIWPFSGHLTLRNSYPYFSLGKHIFKVSNTNTRISPR